MDRRNFLKRATALGMVATLPRGLWGTPSIEQTVEAAPMTDKLWACLLNLSFNFAGQIKLFGGLRTEFELQMAVWDAAIERMVSNRVNMVFINLDDSVGWHSHPEISLAHSWSHTQLRQQLARLRKVGIEPMPMFNFSTTHDAWLGKYAKMVSSDKYYKVCADLIAEAIQLFDTPRFIHFGMDEERIDYQLSDYIVIRQQETWWADLYFYIAEAMKRGVRPCVWSDYVWHHPDDFFKMMPHSVVQCNWWYTEKFSINDVAIRSYLDLAREGYDIIATGSFDQNNPKSIGNTMRFCAEHIDKGHLLGFMQTFWRPVTETYRQPILQGIDLLGTARTDYENKKKKTV
uniref:Tat pathway signal protein n=1 Tax=Prevotella sp. GTC17253 TaxID=3236793 RepID=A0AB33IQ49_9BACT